MDGYKSIKETPTMYFGSSYEAEFETSEESRKDWENLMRETDADAEKFFKAFNHDLIACIYKQCNECYLRGQKGCKHLLKVNVDKMVDNQRRMLIAFNEQQKRNG